MTAAYVAASQATGSSVHLLLLQEPSPHCQYRDPRALSQQNPSGVVVLAGPRPAAMKLERDHAGEGVLGNLGRIRQQLGTVIC